MTLWCPWSCWYDIWLLLLVTIRTNENIAFCLLYPFPSINNNLFNQFLTCVASSLFKCLRTGVNTRKPGWYELVVWGGARYLSPHNTESLRVSGVFLKPERGRTRKPRLSRQAALTSTPGPPYVFVQAQSVTESFRFSHSWCWYSSIAGPLPYRPNTYPLNPSAITLTFRHPASHTCAPRNYWDSITWGSSVCRAALWEALSHFWRHSASRLFVPQGGYRPSDPHEVLVLLVGVMKYFSVFSANIWWFRKLEKILIGKQQV